MTETTIAFLDELVPALRAGDYAITVKQTIDLDAEPFSATRTFTVGGERHSLSPALVGAVFPPDGSLGDHENVLPHVVLNRATLPWERSAGPDGGPWLALLLFTEEERPEPKVVPRSALTPAPPRERHESDTDLITVIDVPATLLKTLLPSRRELSLLAHVRRAATETAVVIGNRLPSQGGTSTVHLVSVEGRYPFDVAASPTVRLVSLASWRFACVTESQSFAHLARDLAGGEHRLRLPDTGQATADAFLDRGYIPVRHRLRQGADTVSWYRGPLVNGPIAADPAPPPGRTPDHLLRVHTGVGMIDVGYAAAWQLGRLLALRSTDVAAGLYAWKRRRRHRLLRESLQGSDGYPLTAPDIDDTLPGGLRAWLEGLAVLDGVPYRYLVPDERLVPVESIRFFDVDQEWTRCLVDGAYSIGRLTAADADLDRRHPLPVDHPRLSGVLIRSDLVAGYPGLRIDGYGADGVALPQLRHVTLTPSVAMTLFDGRLDRLDIHQHPEALHFAVEVVDGTHVRKALRPGGYSDPVELGANRRVPIESLVTALGVDSRGAGAFAAQMIETAERVTFLRG
ncbi:hypothetical protein ACIBHX_04090 [Nonomuraea sp. NPDC050536]|uniref:hypothetical protein n=1 Tax=Nonomuraea sp. NPDC050536 TaxID=3364366 RepID=UPI0037C7488E